jgi:hypothetical protein
MGQHQAILKAVMPRLFVGGMSVFANDACGSLIEIENNLEIE